MTAPDPQSSIIFQKHIAKRAPDMFEHLGLDVAAKLKISGAIRPTRLSCRSSLDIRTDKLTVKLGGEASAQHGSSFQLRSPMK